MTRNRLQIPAELHISSSFSNRSEPDPNIGAIQRRMAESDLISIQYTRVWARSHVWYRRGEIVLVPDKSFVDGSRSERALPPNDMPNFRWLPQVIHCLPENLISRMRL